jgi:hypothetical protein
VSPVTFVGFSVLRCVAIEKAGLRVVPAALGSLSNCLEVHLLLSASEWNQWRHFQQVASIRTCPFTAGSEMTM